MTSRDGQGQACWRRAVLHWTEWSGEDELIMHPRTLIVYDFDDDDNNESLISQAYQKLFYKIQIFIRNMKISYRNNSIKNAKLQKVE